MIYRYNKHVPRGRKSFPLLWAVVFAFGLIASTCSKKKSDGPPPPVTLNGDVTIQGNQNEQVIQGFGAATVFSPPNTSALTSVEFDRLFGSADGQVGLSILRIRIASDDGWRATELNHAKSAIQRGARVIACPWSPPARMKTNNNLIGGKLIPDSAANFGKYLNDFALYMAANAAPLYAVSVQNEPDWNPSYEGCVWTAEETQDFLRNHGGMVTATRLMAPELVNNNQAYVNTILNDNGAVANLDIVSTHIYGGGIVENALARTNNKEVWMTEHLDTLTTYAANLKTAVEIHDCFTKANFNAYIWWYAKRFYGPIGQDGTVTKRGFFISQFARFIRPGSVRVRNTANSRSEVLVSAYKNGSKYVILLINTGDFAVNQKMVLQGMSSTSFVPYLTSDTKNTERGSAINRNVDTVRYTVPAKAMVSLVEE